MKLTYKVNPGISGPGHSSSKKRIRRSTGRVSANAEHFFAEQQKGKRATDLIRAEKT